MVLDEIIEGKLITNFWLIRVIKCLHMSKNP